MTATPPPLPPHLSPGRKKRKPMTPMRRGFFRIGVFGLAPLWAFAFLSFCMAKLTRGITPETSTTVVYVGSQKYELPGVLDPESVLLQYGRSARAIYPREAALLRTIDHTARGSLLAISGLLWFAFWNGVGWVVEGFRKDEPTRPPPLPPLRLGYLDGDRPMLKVFGWLALIALACEVFLLATVGRGPADPRASYIAGYGPDSWSSIIGEELGATLAIFIFGAIGASIVAVVTRKKCHPRPGLGTGALMALLMTAAVFTTRSFVP